jgi:hypothetical protein
MKGKRFTETQIIRILQEAEAGLSVADVCRKHNCAGQEWHCWKPGRSNVGEPLLIIYQWDDPEYGSVEVFGVTHIAQVRVTGLKKRWDFGDNGEYGLVMNPDGMTGYYEFPGGGIEVAPSQHFQCSLEK